MQEIISEPSVSPSSCHFTYQPPDLSRLLQGDILKKTKELEVLLEKIHPWCKNNYKYLMILTQSCDLELRGPHNIPKAKYITLSLIRPLSEAINKELNELQVSEIDKKGNFVSESKKDRLAQFLEGLINNNDSDYFFLFKDIGVGLAENYVAFLRLSIPIQSSLHYKDCLDAKVAQLDENFRSKLGWLVGNLYARVATKDWNPEELKKIIEDLLQSSVFWVDGKKLEKLRKDLENKDINQFSEDNLHELITAIQIPGRKQIVINGLEQVLNESGFLEKDKIKQILTNFSNKSSIKQQLE